MISTKALGKRANILIWAVLLLVLVLWWMLGNNIVDTLFPIVWVLVTQLIFAGMFEAARLRRRAWLGQYLRKTSPWSHWLRGGVVMVTWHQIVSGILAVMLLVSLRLADFPEIVLLMVGSIMCWQCSRWIRSCLATHVIPEYLSAVTRRLLVAPVSALLAFILIALSLLQPQPYLIDKNLSSALEENFIYNGQSIFSIFERMANVLEVASLWAVQNGLNNLDVAGWVAVLGWIILFIMQGVLALTFIRLIVGVAAMCDALQYLKCYSGFDNSPLPEDSRKEIDE